MNETTGKTASCLAITEKRAHKPGGCVGIFFQLFDWNRRFAKKKLFSRKLLPPARSKQVSNKFGGDDKMPKTKLHLIDGENSGGFPNVKKNGNRSSNVGLEGKHEMKVPGLVARLMGLESMPAVQKDKPKKASLSGSCDVREEKFLNEHSGSSREDLSSVKVGGKIESRPQKIQKTGQFERQAVTRFGTEALQIKGVLSRSRKHHHHKLPAPVKSPRVSSVKNVSRTSRLIDAASKILEPGLQATNRAKSALTYSSSSHYADKDEALTEARTGFMSPDLSKQSGYNVSAGKSLMGQTSCRSCVNFLDVVDCRPNVEEEPFVCSSSGSNLGNTSSPGMGKSKPRPPASSIDNKKDVDLQQWDQPISLTALEKKNSNTRSGTLSSPDRKPSIQDSQAQSNLTSQQRKPQKEEPCSFTFKQRNQNPNQMALERDRIPSRAKMSNLQSPRVSSAVNTVNGAKDFVALNRSLSGCSRTRIPAKLDNSSCDADRKAFSQRDDSLSQLRTPIRKRRTISVSGQVENTGFLNSTPGRQRNVRYDVVNGKETSHIARSVDQTSFKSRAASHRDGNRPKESDVISFTFNSPLRHKNGSSMEMKEQIKDPNEFVSKSTCQRKVIDENDGSSLLKPLPLSGDALGALLEEKLKELTSQEEDELMTAGSQPKRSAATILQELISALTAEQQIWDSDAFDADIAFQTKAKTNSTLVGYSREGDHLSPGSVLEAPFPNDSCISSSLDDSSGHRLHLDYMDYSQNQMQSTEPDADLLDSATSLSKGMAGNQVVIDLINQISRLLHGINYAGFGLRGSKLIHAKDVILNAELFFGSGITDSLVAPFLLEQLEALARAMWFNFNCLLGFEDTKECNKLRGFLFDCVIECFDAKCVPYSNSRLKVWTRLPLRMKAEMLMREVGEEVIRWTHLAGTTPDEIIEFEMSHSLGKWTDFDIEAFETGAEIGLDILQILVEEIVIDLWECRLVYL